LFPVCLLSAGVCLICAACSGDGIVTDEGAVDVSDVVSGDVIVGDLPADEGSRPDLAGLDAVETADDSVEPVDAAETIEFDYTVPWVPPAGPWPTCEGVTGTSRNLAAKAAYYDWIGPKLHQEPRSGAHENVARMYNVTCDGPVPTAIVPDGDLPTCTLNSSENNGLWTSLYVASQCFRYGATHDPEALANVKRTLAGTYELMQITGRPGLYARESSDPAIAPMQTCPEDPLEYTPPDAVTRKGNRWVKVDTDGCMLDYDSATSQWVKHPDVCTDVKYAGRCWKRNVSKDEYSGHLYAAGVCARVVDDPEVRTMATGILSQIAYHLIDNGYWLTDFDGTPTRYGSMYALSFDHFAGFNATLAMVSMKSAAMTTGDQRLTDEYYNCLLQAEGTLQCIEREWDAPTDYTTYISELGLKMGCETNFDNVSMMLLAYLNEIWYEPSVSGRARFRQYFEQASRGPDSAGRDIWAMQVPFYNFMIAAAEGDTEMTTERRALIESMVNDGVCMLKNFQETQIERDESHTDMAVACTSERYGDLVDGVMPIEDRCTSTFEWWGDPSAIESCTANPNRADSPAGFLAPYWMGRYFGFISADM